MISTTTGKREPYTEMSVSAMKTGWTYVLAVVLSALAAVSAVRLYNPPEPERCALCGYDEEAPLYLAPAIINLATGDICELQMYELDVHDRSKLAAVQQTGAVYFPRFDGAEVMIDKGVSCCVIFTKELERIDRSLYCRDCRKLLTGAATRGCVLLDLHDLNNMRAYPIKQDAAYEINGYSASVGTETITVYPDGEKECTKVVVTGHLRNDAP